MKTTLPDIIDRTLLRRMAGRRSFSRGLDYFENEQVGDLAEYQGVITARVRGTRSYKVKLWLEGEALAHSCSCPVGGEGDFCKHCVAVGLAWLEGRRGTEDRPAKSAQPPVTLDDAKKWLERQEKSTLVDMLLKQALEDERLQRHLLLKAAKLDSLKGVNVDAYRDAVKYAVNNYDGFIDYNSVHDYAQGIEDAVDGIEGLLKEGYAKEVIGLAEYAIRQIEPALNSVDDSDGYMGSLLDKLQEIHLCACRKARPEPEALARRLFDWELHASWHIFSGAAQTYGNVFGKKGLAVYRQLAEAEWARVPELAAGQGMPSYGKRYRITEIMEALARQGGDVEELVSVLKRDLSSAFAYFKIAEAYKQGGEPDMALDWAERGLKAFPERTDSRLREFVAQEYFRRRRHEDGMALVWKGFIESAHVDEYKKLKEYADRIGQWTVWRGKAVAFMREEIVKAKKASGRDKWGWRGPADASFLVEIFLWEEDGEAAWQEAEANGCSNHLWLELARRREKDHPADALSVYQNQIEPTLALKNNGAYQEAVRFLRKIGELMERVGQGGDFNIYLASLRASHKPKRNFIKLLDRIKV